MKQVSSLSRVSARFCAWAFCISCCIVSAETVDFVHEVVPILRAHCVKCHGGEEAKGGFSLNTRKLFLEGGAAEPGNAKESHFLELIGSADLEMQMPPKASPRVPLEQRQVLIRWVNAGMPWTSGFTFRQSSYQPPLLPRQVILPGPAELNPIDQILQQHFRKTGQTPPAKASDATFLRRVSLDLVGLLPTPEQRQVFLSGRDPGKRQQLVDDLLARDVDYAEHWLTFWNDLLRNDYTGTGFITGGRKQISKWLYRSLIENKPYDQFARELIAPPTKESRGFIDGIKWRGEVSAGQTVEIQFAQSVAQSFLGINLKCASCHDSFIDQWKLTDAYSLAAVYSNRKLDIHRCDKPTGEVATPAWLFPELGSIDAGLSPDARLKQLADLMTDHRNGRFARTIVNRLWAQLMGRGIVHPLDAMHTEPWNEDLLDYLANVLVESGYDLKSVLRLIASSDVYGAESAVLGSGADADEDVFGRRRAHRMTAEQFMDAVWQLTGAGPSKIDAPVIRGKMDPDVAEGMDLKGEWIWGQSQSQGKPAPAGETLVFQAEMRVPSAIETAMAVITVDNAFDLYINRKKVLSGAEWSEPGVVSLTNWLKVQKNDTEPANQIMVVARNAGSSPNLAGLFFQAQLKLKDQTSITLASGPQWTYSDEKQIQRKARSGKFEGPWKKVVSSGRPAVYAGVNGKLRSGLARGTLGDSTMVRAGLVKSDFLMRSLGRPNRDQIVTSRPAELTTLEAIDLSNGETLAKALQTGAGKYVDAGLPDQDLVEQIFIASLTRSPTSDELAVCLDALKTTQLQDVEDVSERETVVQDLLWAILMMPEFIMVR